MQDSEPEKFNFIATTTIRKVLLKESEERDITQSELLREIIEEWIIRNSIDKHKG